MESERRSERVSLVCPNCGSDRLATREQAEIWQPAIFWRASETSETEIEWEMYSSEDIGDTVTIGYACKSCTATYDSPDEFVTPEEYAAARAD